jgi:hypothetical protein
MRVSSILFKEYHDFFDMLNRLNKIPQDITSLPERGERVDVDPEGIA